MLEACSASAAAAAATPQSKAMRVAAEDIPGVKGVVDHTHSGLTLISAV